MRKVQKNFYYLLLLLIISSLTISQTVEKQKLINLQAGEGYILSFSDLITEPATQIDLTPTPASQLINPYNNIVSSTTFPPLLGIVATIDFGTQTQYNIAIKQETNSNANTIELRFMYEQLTIDPGCSCLKQTILYNFSLDQVSSDLKYSYGSFYSYNKGFISYQLENGQIKSFVFSVGEGTAKIDALNVQLYKHVSILGPNNLIYIIQFIQNQEYQLIQFDSQNNSKIIQKSQNFSCETSYPLIDTGRYFFNYCYIQGSSSLDVVSIDFTQLKLSFDSFPLTQNELAFPLIKRIGTSILFGLKSNNNFTILNLSSSDSEIDEPFGWQSYSNINLFLSKVVFISSKLMVYFSRNYLQFFDIEKTVALYQVQVCEDNLNIKFIQNLGNQIAIFIYNQNDEYQKTIIAEVNIPSLLIQTPASTTEPILLSIKTVSSTTYKIAINVQIIQQNDVFFAESQISLQNTYSSSNILSQKYFTIPIEDYVIGADLSLMVQVDQQSQQIFQNPRLIQQLNMKGTSQMIIDETCTSFQTDGYFPSIFQCPPSQQDKLYTQYAIYPFSMGHLGESTASFLIYKSQISFEFPINQIDNKGSFILKATPVSSSFDVYVPFIKSTAESQLFHNQIPVDCSENNFLFASDPSYSVLFTLCGSTVTQIIFRPQKSYGQPQIVSKTILNQNSQLITNMICIQGFLFMYNSETIQAYDYINQGQVGYINIPTITPGKKQTLTIFKSSFLITVLDDPLTTIAQYSYNRFKTNNPTFMRNLQIDSGHPVSSQAIVIPKRSSQKEFAFVLSTKENTYYMYRINSKQWSNQLYTTLNYNLNQAVLSSRLLIQFDKEIYTAILSEASIFYQMGLSTEQFNSKLSQSTQFTISKIQQDNLIYNNLRITSQKQLKDTNSLLINSVLNRDASVNYGVINNNADTLNSIRAQIQDTNYSSGQVFTFNDWQTYNACLLSWISTDQNSQIVQRMANQDSPNIQQAYTILYNKKAVIEQNQIKSFFVISGQFTGCAILDDKGSLRFQDPNYQIFLYVICQKQISQYQITYQINKTTDEVTFSILSSPNIYQISYELYIPQIQRIISSNDQLYLYGYDGTKIWQVNLDNNKKEASFNELSYSYYSYNSIFVLFQFNLQLSIYPTGIIQAQVRSSTQIDVYDITDLLQQKEFIILENDYISRIEQYSDSQFRIAFKNSYIYDVTFSLSNNGQLLIDSAFQYYYQDAFQEFIQGFKGSKYTLLLGLIGENLLQMSALYSNTVQQQNIFLIQSSLLLPNQDIFLYPSCVFEINPNLIQVTYSTGQQALISISDQLGIKPLVSKSQIKNYMKTTISPFGQTNENNSISFVFPGGSSRKSSGIIQLFAIINIISLTIILF